MFGLSRLAHCGLAGMFAAMVALAALAGCAVRPLLPVAPMLRLAPSALGREWTVVQQLEVQAGGQKRSLDIALEVDAQSVRMAFMQWGHTVARLDWDGRQLEQRLVPGWPDAVSAERVLSDLQLVWWPATAVRAALAPGWRLAESRQTRELSYAGRTIASIRMVAPGHIELIQHADGYAVQVHAGDDAPVFATP
ncbi:DUF3261 domain-containing protein [Verminephrobacter eiseniae]|uniref:DUF3261 domain-containing protein n=1 Tax=Verminephrobacter eiseniae TaxID=364317 RepID=UPI00223757CA|nr:DUF3261 domain-containing protein [Verminephrobacter eiseniae]